MELMKSSLNRAHQCGRKANRMMAQEMYEEAIRCHGEAADLLKEALLMTQNEQARLSLELQRDRHLQQQRLIMDTCKRGKLTVRKSTVSSSSKQMSQTALSTPVSCHTAGLVFGQSYPTTTQVPLQGSKTPKDDRTRLEEQITTIGDLRKLLVVLLTENTKLMEENKSLRLENTQLKRGSRHQSLHQTLGLPQDGPDSFERESSGRHDVC